MALELAAILELSLARVIETLADLGSGLGTWTTKSYLGASDSAWLTVMLVSESPTIKSEARNNDVRLKICIIGQVYLVMLGIT